MTLKIKFNLECLVKYRDQVQVPLQELLNKTKEINKALNKEIALEDALKQLNTIKTEQKCEDAEEEGGERGPQ